MKLSTAIQRGCHHDGVRGHAVGVSQRLPDPASPQAGAGQWAKLDFTSCVIGLAWHGLDFPDDELLDGFLVLRKLSAATDFDLLSTFVIHPLTELPMSLAGAVFSLHTSHGWTDEEIIAWLVDLGY